mmetsp:Transcript_3781/g.10927  ORF Transcript_3781/g.10927 Transcript_3781/m.10927 type:complete len:203 (+) Transcript_3781:296-904(+)
MVRALGLIAGARLALFRVPYAACVVGTCHADPGGPICVRPFACSRACRLGAPLPRWLDVVGYPACGDRRCCVRPRRAGCGRHWQWQEPYLLAASHCPVGGGHQAGRGASAGRGSRRAVHRPRGKPACIDRAATSQLARGSSKSFVFVFAAPTFVFAEWAYVRAVVPGSMAASTVMCKNYVSHELSAGPGYDVEDKRIPTHTM